MIQSNVSTKGAPYWAERHKIPGMFEDIDFLLFDWILHGQQHSPWATQGDTLEVGTYLGKSAIVVGLGTRPSETFHACDVYEEPVLDLANQLENADSYAGLTKAQFVENYHHYVGSDPHVLQILSSELPSHLAPGSIRFAHIDGGHLFEVVAGDIATAQSLLVDGGVVVLDDFRAVHTPGVAAAVWAAVAQGLVPICVSECKFYGTWDADVATAIREELKSWLATHPEVHHGVQSVSGHELVIVQNPRIWTMRRRVKAALPPVVTEAILRREPPHLGA